MNHVATTIATAEQLAEFLDSDNIRNAAASARSILVQIFVGHRDDAWIMCLVAAVQKNLPEAIIIGATSAGEISSGSVTLASTALSIAFFDAAVLYPLAFDCSHGNEYAAGTAVAGALQKIPHLRAILLLAPPTRINCAKLLQGIGDTLPATPVFGGGATETLDSGQPRVFLQSALFETGCAAVGLAGEDLHIETHAFLGWQTLGPKMLLTSVIGFELRTIDDQPALEAYRKYLGIRPGNQDIYLIEFPLLIERHGAQIARNPLTSDNNGYVTLVADIYQGETARLGYLDVDSVLAYTQAMQSRLERFSPQAIYIYSCICRRFTLQEDIELEISPFQTIAPVAGFFTSGEFCRNGEHLQLLNSSQVIVALREGDAAPAPRQKNAADGETEMHRYRFRHARITSRLFHFIAALSDELEGANRKLRYLSEHDALTDTLNRRVLDATLDKELSRSARYRRPFAFVMFDLDHFKLFNDDYGHAAGDLVLKSTAQTVRKMIRGSDQLYRYGGEEFLLLLPETDLAGALEIAEKARVAITQLSLNHAGSALPRITASFGAASYPQHGQDGLEVLNAADDALYEAKGQGRNRVVAA